MNELYNELNRFAERINGDYITPRATELIEKLEEFRPWRNPDNKYTRPLGLEEVLGTLDGFVTLDDWSEVETELTISYNVRTGFELACKWDVLPPKWYAIDWEKTINIGKGETLDEAICDLLEKMIAEKEKMMEWYFDDEVDDEDYYIDEKYEAYRIARDERKNR